MSAKLQPVRGTHDLFGEEFEKFQAVVNCARDLAALYGFQEAATPVFESTEVFARSIGETSDIVGKEMFTMETKGGDKITLRPEFTAGIARAFISNGWQQHLPLKLFSTGPLFRYERPQKGRQRQFHQVNFEWLGDGGVGADAEMILLAAQMLFMLTGKKSACALHVNTLGDAESRAAYHAALVEYLSPYAAELSEDSQRRLATNPLRILDSKAPRDREILEGAPVMTDFLTTDARARMDALLHQLSDAAASLFLDIKYDPALVRGLDYYTSTVFEFVGEVGELGAQSTVLAGGRYDTLIEHMGGKPTPAIGFAAGIERLLLLAAGSDWLTPVKDFRVALIPLEGVGHDAVQRIATLIRQDWFSWKYAEQHPRKDSLEVWWEGTYDKRLKRAVSKGFSHILKFGLGEEAGTYALILRDLATTRETPILNPIEDNLRIALKA